MTSSKTISIKLPINIFSKIDDIASERKRKKTDILKEALETYIDEWSDYKIAAQRLKDPSDEILTGEEFLNDLKEDLGWKI
jgi:RHH-type rel operon transcriptional repressor/antitoxin RelB